MLLPADERRFGAQGRHDRLPRVAQILGLAWPTKGALEGAEGIRNCHPFVQTGNLMSAKNATSPSRRDLKSRNPRVRLGGHVTPLSRKACSCVVFQFAADFSCLPWAKPTSEMYGSLNIAMRRWPMKRSWQRYASNAATSMYASILSLGISYLCD